jgi:hypothetical protein
MVPSPPPIELRDALLQVVGYANFSAGNSDPQTLIHLNRLIGTASAGRPLSGPPAYLTVRGWLDHTLDQVGGSPGPFADASQARAVIDCVWSDLLPTYFDFHRDLLYHQRPEVMLNGFFIGRCLEAVLAQGGPWDERDRIVRGAIERLNDFVGYRPVAVLEGRKITAYSHEFVRPVPLFIRGCGVAAGPYQTIVERALEILSRTDPDLLRRASFDLTRLTELSYDPRAYDFDHPVNHRPNYQFGLWDPDHLDAHGAYDRFVLQQVTLDALLARVGEEQRGRRDEVLTEAATVLAGTVLMASFISGWSPSTHDSTVTLGSLMQPIAELRDEFYAEQLEKLSGAHQRRLRDEAARRRQPFGAARQHLNSGLAQQRARQLQHVQLARLFARMGYPEAAQRQADIVPVASARMLCRIDCLLTEGRRAIRAGRLDSAARTGQDAFDLLQRAITCGAVVDPWNLLGFAGNFARFHGPESGVHDQRVDDLLAHVEQLFAYLSQLWSDAAARDDERTYTVARDQFRRAADWWRQYAAHTVESLQAIDPQETFASAELVARALQLWHRGGAGAGDIKFWAPHAELFDSPRAYSLVIDSLLVRRDFVASQALLVHWLSQADTVGLRRGECSVARSAERWLDSLRQAFAQGNLNATETWRLSRRLFDRFEANAGIYGEAPRFQLAVAPPERAESTHETAEIEESGSPDGPNHALFEAAYEGVVYEDSTDDGRESPLYEEDDGTADELQAESRRLTDHLSFLGSLARLWTAAAGMPHHDPIRLPRDAEAAAAAGPDSAAGAALEAASRNETMRAWAARAAELREGLAQLLDQVRRYRISPPRADEDSMRQYDRRRTTRDALIERIITTAVETADARRLLTSLHQALEPDGGGPETACGPWTDDDRQTIAMIVALRRGDAAAIQRIAPQLLAAMRGKNLLYVPLSRGGDPVEIYAARLRQRMLSHLLTWLPRAGQFALTCQLLELARQLEQQHPVGPHAVTEFDGLFRTGFRALVESLLENVCRWHPNATRAKLKPKSIVPFLETLTEILLASWLAHSRTLRLSALEAVRDQGNWQRLTEFIRRYGGPLFTQSFFKLGNIRAILHQGVANWLRRCQESPDELAESQLLSDLENEQLDPAEAEHELSIVLEAILDHHAEYRDYNSTTTQSDRGEMLYTLLDFLRLRVRYDRVAWNLRPVVWAHELLVRQGFDAAAASWRRGLAERIGAEADLYTAQLRALQAQYAMRMPTVADRIGERFMMPMTIDRMRALIAPAVADADAGRTDSDSFELLEREIGLLTRQPIGVGLDLPAWLATLEEEVEAAFKRRHPTELADEGSIDIPRGWMDETELRQQLELARKQTRRLPFVG